MTKKVIILLFFIIIVPILSDDSSKLDIVTKEAVIDFDKNEFKAEGGIQFNYNDINLKAYQITKLEGMNVIKADEDVIFQKGENTVESEKLVLNLDYEEAKMNNALSYVLVKDAPERHNRLYYGGEEFTAYYPDSVYIKNGWFSTSHRALKMNNESQNPEEILPYHMKAKKINVYPEEKLVSYNNILYVGDKPVLWLPWYATSLKAETQAPLFPLFGSDSDYGDYIIWGIDYGRNQNYINGSAAFKYSSERGFFIEDWENVYKINGNKNNSGKLTLSETLIIPKGVYEEQWSFQHSHTYEGEKGKLNWEYQNQTLNTINTVEEDQDDAEDDGDDDPYENYEQKLARYFLETDLSKLGKNEDISLYGKIEYVDNSEALEAIIDSISEDILDDYDGAELDNEIETNLKLVKDNRRYKLMFHFEDFEDLDEGSTYDDLMSFSKQREYELDLKEYGIDIYYNKEEEDEWRTLSSSERESDDEELKDYTGDAYNPFTTEKYDIIETEENRLTFGDYTVFEDYKLTLEYDKETYYEKLNRDEDPFSSDEEYERDREYNGSIDIIEEETEEIYYSLELSHESKSMDLTLGTYFEEYKDRSDYDDYEGTESYDGYDTFTNDSKYRELEIRDKEISLSQFGNLDAQYSFRQDIYAELDELREHEINLVHTKELYDNSWDFSREADIKLSNELSYDTLFYNYYANSRSFPDSDDSYIESAEDAKYYRLENDKENQLYEDTVTLKVGNTVTEYNIELDNYFDAYDTNWQTDKDFENSVNFKIDNESTVYVLYGVDKDYQEDGYTNKQTDNWEVTLADVGREFSYSNSRTVSKVRKSSVDTTENYSDRDTTYSYLRYEDTNKEDNFSYGFGEKNKKWWTLEYGVETNQTYDYYDTDGDAVNSYSDDNIKTSYSLAYLLGEEAVKAHNVEIAYNDYDDYEDTEYSYYQYSFEYTYVDNKSSESDEKEEIAAEDENGENLVLTEEEQSELERKLTQLNQKSLDASFDLMGIGEISNDVTYKEYYRFYVSAKVDKDYQEEAGFSQAFEEFKIRTEYNKERTEVSYEYTEESDIDEDDGSFTRELESKTHEFEFSTKFGDLDHAWKIGASITYEAYIEDSDSERKLDEWSVEIGREFEYAEWTLGYEMDWNTTYTRYDYTISYKINLLTFPEKLFGLKKENTDSTVKLEAGM